MTRALASDPEDRYQSAATLSADLRGVAAVLDMRTAAHEAAFIDDVPSAAGRGIRWLLALLVLGVAVAGLWGWRDPARLQWRRWFGPPPAPILVVMPFEVEGTMPTITADAVAEDLQNRLGMVGTLKVVSRSSLRSQRGREPRAVARTAGAAVALVGTIRGTGDQVAMDLALVDAMTGATLWTRALSSTKRELFVAESTLTGEVAGAFGLALPNGAAEARAASRTVDGAAYDLYARGRDAESRGDLTEAGHLYEQAIAADGSLAEAYAALATVSYRDMMRSARWDDGAAWARIRQSAENAAAADPDLPAAQLAAALAARTMEQALPLFARAITMDPSRGETYSELAAQIDDVDPSRATALYRSALALDADRAESLAGLAESSIRLERFQEADTGIARGRQLYPSFSRWSHAQAYAEMARGRFPAAVAALRDPATRTGDPAAGLLYVRALIGAGSLSDARAEAARLVQQFPDYCEARATWAGLLLDAGKPQDARREAERIFVGAASTDAEPGRVGCAAVAAAALGQADVAGRWLQRTAAAEPSLRMWALQRPGRGLTRKWYPWVKVAASPAVMAGMQALETAYASLRKEVATALPTTGESQQSSR